MLHSVRIWDLPTRLFHAVLLLVFAGLIVSGEWGGDWMVWHYCLGYLTLALLLFRLVWGFVGGHWSRFAHFVVTPTRAWRYLRQSPKPLAVGHNPLGAWSVLVLLLFLLLQVLSGLALDDEQDFVGPLAAFVSDDTADLLYTYHLHIGKKVLVLLVMLHVAAIAYYRWRLGRHLVRPMISGDKWLPPGVPPSRDDARSRLLAALLFLGAAALVAWISRF